MSLKGRNMDCLGTLKSAKRMKTEIKKINYDIDIIIEAISNGDTNDAIQMLLEVKQDLKLIELIA